MFVWAPGQQCATFSCKENHVFGKKVVGVSPGAVEAEHIPAGFKTVLGLRGKVLVTGGLQGWLL